MENYIGWITAYEKVQRLSTLGSHTLYNRCRKFLDIFTLIQQLQKWHRKLEGL
jgi:hypothetical protein